MLYDSGWILPLGTPGNSLLPAVQLLCLCSLAPCGECDQLLATLPVQAFSIRKVGARRFVLLHNCEVHFIYWL